MKKGAVLVKYKWKNYISYPEADYILLKVTIVELISLQERGRAERISVK